MKITWDKDKNEGLKNERGVSFEQIASMVHADDVLDYTDNPSSKYAHQKALILRINDYTWVCPVFREGDTLKLITAFPCRKSHKIYKDW